MMYSAIAALPGNGIKILRINTNQTKAIAALYTTLPGPTGESNTLHLEARGCVVCYADKSTSFNFLIDSTASGSERKLWFFK